MSGSSAQGIALYTSTAETLPTVSGGTVDAPDATCLRRFGRAGTTTHGGIRVQVGGFVGKPLGILTKQNAAGSAAIKATFTSDRTSAQVATRPWTGGRSRPSYYRSWGCSPTRPPLARTEPEHIRSFFTVSSRSFNPKTPYQALVPPTPSLTEVLWTPSLDAQTFLCFPGGTIVSIPIPPTP